MNFKYCKDCVNRKPCHEKQWSISKDKLKTYKNEIVCNRFNTEHWGIWNSMQKPKTIFDNVEIKSYQEKIVPRFLYELKEDFKEIYDNFIKEYPKYINVEMNFIDRYAYIKTLRNGTELKDCHNNIWKIEDDEIVCYKWKTWLPFGKTPTETRIKITDDMKYKITDNKQVDENTKFED